MGMKSKGIISIFLWMLLAVTACSKKSEDPVKMISGEGAKIWKEQYETSADGKKHKPTKEEKSEAMEFYSNHTFKVNTATENSSGKWSYDETSKNLSLEFGSSNFTQNFTVLNLEKDMMTLKANDGSTLTFKSAE
jgi:hypothetical protein